MSNEIRQTELREKTQQLLQGPLKHIRAASLAAALLPLASVVATPASAQTVCPSAGICGTVFTDTNNNGIQDAGDTPIADVAVTICLVPCDGTINVPFPAYANPNGFYFCSDCVLGGTYTVAVLIPTGTQPSPVVVGGNAGVTNGGCSVATAVASESGTVIDFGFAPSQQQPGTGTPGYWKNHPDAWPASIAALGIKVGAVTYTETEAIAWLTKVGKDKTTTMFAALVPAMLNVLIGNDGNCVTAAIAAGNAWMTTYPVGSNVAASSYAWSIGQPTQQTLDAYNNGLLCAPHRQ